MRVRIDARVELIIGFCDSSAERSVVAIALQNRLQAIQTDIDTACRGESVLGNTVPCLANMGILGVSEVEMRSRRQVLTKALKTMQRGVRGMLARRMRRKFQEIVKEAVVEKEKSFRFQLSLVTPVMWKKEPKKEEKEENEENEEPAEGDSWLSASSPPCCMVYPRMGAVSRHIATDLSLGAMAYRLQESSVVVGVGIVTCTFELTVPPERSEPVERGILSLKESVQAAIERPTELSAPTVAEFAVSDMRVMSLDGLNQGDPAHALKGGPWRLACLA